MKEKNHFLYINSKKNNNLRTAAKIIAQISVFDYEEIEILGDSLIENVPDKKS